METVIQLETLQPVRQLNHIVSKRFQLVSKPFMTKPKAVKNQTFPTPRHCAQSEPAKLNQHSIRHGSSSLPARRNPDMPCSLGCLGALFSPGRKPRHLPANTGKKSISWPARCKDTESGAIILLRLFSPLFLPKASGIQLRCKCTYSRISPPPLPSRPSILVLKFSVQRSRTKSVSHKYMHTFLDGKAGGSKYVDAKP